MILSKIKSLVWADFFLYALLDPRSLYRQIGKNDPAPLALSFTVPLVTAATGILALALMGNQSYFFYTKITYGWMLIFIFDCFWIVTAAALMDALAQFMGYRGNVREMISLVNFSLLPRAFVLPLVFIFAIVNFAPIFMYGLFSLALIVWSVWIAVVGISEMHSMSPARAVLVFLFPVLFVGLCLFFIMLLAAVSLFSLL
jgi:hypothetical protein